MSQHAHFLNDQTSEQTLNVRLIRDLFPTDGLQDFTHQIENKELELLVVLRFGGQVLDLGNGVGDGAPDDIAFVFFVRLQ